MNTPGTKVLDEIQELNETALTQYKLLAELEIEGKKKSTEYKNTLDNIRLIAHVINKKLANLQISDENLLRYEENLARSHNYDGEDEDILVEALFQNTSDFAAKRLSMQIFNYSLIHYCYTVEDEDIDEEYAEYEDEINDMIDDDANKEIDFELIKDRLINHTFLYYLDEAIKKEPNQEVKKILIRTKYNVIYLIYPMENFFLEKQSNFTNPQLYQEIIGYQEENVDLEEAFIQPNEEMITCHLETLAEIDDEYYDRFENNVKVYLLSLYIKTLISINISERADTRLKDFRKNLQLKSQKTKKFIDEAYKTSKKLSIVKKVDL